MKKNSLQSYKVQYRLKTELKTTNLILISPLRMSSLVVVHCSKLSLFNFFAIVILVFYNYFVASKTPTYHIISTSFFCNN